jgi:hypothetical protein
MKKADRVTLEVRALAALDLSGLRDAWRRHQYGEPPKMRSRELLARLLAWKIQAEAFGGLDATTIRLLKSNRASPSTPLLDPGTCLAREWQGRRYEVEVLKQGFQHNGIAHRSLSEVARVITGTRWNGLRFFGLREPSGK